MKRLYIAILAGALGLGASAQAGTHKAPAGSVGPPNASTASLDQLSKGRNTREAVRLYRKPDYREASVAFETALVTDTTNYRLAYMLGLSFLQRGRYVDARDAYRQALELAPDHKTASEIYGGMAYSYEADHQTRMAHFYYHLACHKDKSNHYAQAGAIRTEYKHHHDEPHKSIARQGTESSRSSG